MKNIIYYILPLFFSLLLVSCGENKFEPVFDEEVDVRIQKQIDHYKETLTASPNGWILSLPTKLGGFYRVWIDFNKEGRVVMLSDQNDDTATQMDVSSYRLGHVQAVALYFDSGSYVSDIADPDKSVSGADSNGTGQGSDFEFYLMGEDGGVLNLVGRFNKTQATLRPATAKEVAIITDGGFKKLNDSSQEYFKNMRIPAVDLGGIKVGLDISTRKTSYKYLSKAGTLMSGEVSSYIDLDGLLNNKKNGTIYLSSPISVGGEKITQFDWDEENNSYKAVMTDGSNSKVYDNLEPVIPMRFGYNKDYNFIEIDERKIGDVIKDPFSTSVFEKLKTEFKRITNRSLVYFTIRFAYDDASMQELMTINILYLSGSSQYSGNIRTEVSYTEDGFLTFGRAEAIDGNGRVIVGGLGVLIDFFANNRFKIGWSPIDSGYMTDAPGAFFVVDENGNVTDNFMPGIVSKK